jgi:predicted NAD-dependent protein-ADP-ribosyltransferase YbiA (DUF1768 family)
MKTATLKYTCGHSKTINVDLRNPYEKHKYQATQKHGGYDEGMRCAACSRDLDARLLEELTPEEAVMVLRVAAQAHRARWETVKSDTENIASGVTFFAVALMQRGLLQEAPARKEFEKEYDVIPYRFWAMTREEIDQQLLHEMREELLRETKANQNERNSSS